MTAFALRDGELCAERVPLASIAERHGTPCYVYSRAALEEAWRGLDGALAGIPHLVCYAMKANPTLAVLDVFARLGSGFDIVSGGELDRVIAAGGDPGRTVFSGVGKSLVEMHRALDAGILCFNVESEAELARLDAAARSRGRVAPVSFRVNPDVDAKTHPYISTGLKETKFGVAWDDALPLYRSARGLAGIALRGIDIHIGSQITELAPYREAAAKLVDLVDRLAGEGIALEHIDLGGGLGIRYRDETPVPLAEYAGLLRELFAGRRERLLLEPGRLLVGDAGVLVTRVEYLKPGPAKHFAIVDAAMNDLLRPALYGAWHAVEAVRPHGGAIERWDIVGPVCESADFLAHDRDLALAAGDLLAIRSAGAYGMAMSSNYNARPRAAEVMVDGDRAHLVRRRETASELHAAEATLPR
ncbi:MAG TPA: diaminopimelate decarboxylase [Casimicrobiaceae bacterium]|jgi:diaminopimelate decarboxylase|nr:diaminopimelate decarboxylase [Casimicrobiaceae bacterium]